MSAKAEDADDPQFFARVLCPPPTNDALLAAIEYYERVGVGSHERGPRAVVEPVWNPREFDDILDIHTYDDVMDSF